MACSRSRAGSELVLALYIRCRMTLAHRHALLDLLGLTRRPQEPFWGAGRENLCASFPVQSQDGCPPGI